MITVNAYIKDTKGSIWKTVHDKFPVNTWKGTTKEQILQCVSNILNTTDINGVTRLDVVIDPDHPLASVGQNPRMLGDE